MADSSDNFLGEVARHFESLGYEAILANPDDCPNHSLELRRKGERLAVLVRSQKARCNVSQIRKFQDFLESGAGFSKGWFVSRTGFSQPALTSVESESPENLRLGTWDGSAVEWDYPEGASDSPAKPAAKKKKPKPEPRTRRYVGVFTCKGGVGKTTVAAHLAGAFALIGHDVILLDLDPDRNLRKLFLQSPDDDEDASLYVPPPASRKGEIGKTITVLDEDDWRESDYPEAKTIICDCSPVLSQNPPGLIEKLDYCIIPTTLNPLGINKNGDVIIRTLEHIREQNKTAEMFVLVNGYDCAKDMAKRNDVLLNLLERSLKDFIAADPKCKLIHPDAAKVRFSRALRYWGYHIVDGTEPQLAFREVAGRSHPREDFLQLADYLENHTDIDEMRAAGHL